MKTFRFFSAMMIAYALIVVTFSSCSEDDEDSKNYYSSDLIGYWNCVSMENEYGTKTWDIPSDINDEDAFVFIFQKYGSSTLVMDGEVIYAKWKYAKDILRFDFNFVGEALNFTVVKLDASELILEIGKKGKDYEKMTFKRDIENKKYSSSDFIGTWSCIHTVGFEDDGGGYSTSRTWDTSFEIGDEDAFIVTFNKDGSYTSIEDGKNYSKKWEYINGLLIFEDESPFLTIVKLDSSELIFERKVPFRYYNKMTFKKISQS